MTTPNSFRRRLLAGCFLLTAVCSLEARIGETKQEVEARMLADRNAIAVPHGLVQRALNHRSVAYRQLYELFPAGAVHEFYYKTDDGSQATTEAVKDKLFP
ncbi:MAG: hypothetical protein AAGF10_07665, partial [Verrucomicrobiota bacterium]